MAEWVLIAAVDRQNAIGRDNALPWHLPADLQRFKRLTLGHSVLMGRRTAQSIGRALPGRRNLVLSRAGRAPWPGQEVVASLDQAQAATAGEATLFVIGGAQVYRQALDRARRIELTRVDTVVDGADAFFPALDADAWDVVAQAHHPADARHAHAMDFLTLQRR